MDKNAVEQLKKTYGENLEKYKEAIKGNSGGKGKGGDMETKKAKEKVKVGEKVVVRARRSLDYLPD